MREREKERNNAHIYLVVGHGSCIFCEDLVQSVMCFCHYDKHQVFDLVTGCKDLREA